MSTQGYEDFKYVMLDTAFMYLGAKYSYGEIVTNEDVPFKFRAMVERYILPETDAETTLESHFYYMNSKDFACRTYRQMKIKVKVSHMVEKKGFFGLGKVQKIYKTEMIPLDKFVAMSKAEKESKNILIQEIVVNKLAMMTFVL